MTDITLCVLLFIPYFVFSSIHLPDHLALFYCLKHSRYNLLFGNYNLVNFRSSLRKVQDLKAAFLDRRYLLDSSAAGGSTTSDLDNDKEIVDLATLDFSTTSTVECEENHDMEETLSLGMPNIINKLSISHLRSVRWHSYNHSFSF